MDIVSTIIVILIGIILILTFYIIGIYNELIDAKSKIEHQFKEINKELNKLTKTLPEVIETVTKLAKHEDIIIKNLNDIKLEKDISINEKIDLYKKINNTLHKVYNLKETYPKLVNNKEFKLIEEKTKEIKHKIKYASEFYDKAVNNYDELKRKKMHNLVSQLFKIEEYNLFN